MLEPHTETRVTITASAALDALHRLTLCPRPEAWALEDAERLEMFARRVREAVSPATRSRPALHFERFARDGKPEVEFRDSAGHECRVYVGTASPRLRLGRDSRCTGGALDLDSAGARAVARLLLAWADSGDLGRVSDG